MQIDLDEHERLKLLMAVEMKAIADKFGGLRGWELVEKTQLLKEMGNEGCVRQ